jgi:hypothetical protein
LKNGVDFSIIGIVEEDTEAFRQKFSALYYPTQIQRNNNHRNNPNWAPRRLQVEIFGAKYLLLSDNREHSLCCPTVMPLCAA